MEWVQGFLRLRLDRATTPISLVRTSEEFMPKKKLKSSKPTGKKVYRINWLNAAPFLKNGFTLLDVKTRGKEMIAEMHAPEKSKS